MAQPGVEESRVWAEGLEQPIPAMVARAVGLDRLNMEPAKFAAWVKGMIDTLDAADLIGRTGMERCLDRVTDYAAKRDAIAKHLQEGRSWLAVEGRLHIPWHEQVRILAHNRPTTLWTWDDQRRLDFELDVREGKSLAALGRDYGLKPHLCRSLVNMFRGNLRAS